MTDGYVRVALLGRPPVRIHYIFVKWQPLGAAGFCVTDCSQLLSLSLCYDRRGDQQSLVVSPHLWARYTLADGLQTCCCQCDSR